jgi:phospholipid/cholesterol/gamma-HCH transport system substrate-binding protein
VREKTIEMLVGLFMLAGILALVILALKVSGLSQTVSTGGYVITANFDNVGDLKVRAPVTISGVRVGEVTGIKLDTTTFKAIVNLRINPNQDKIPTDTSASIYTQGLLGSNYVNLSPGYDQTYLKNGDEIDNTHPALILENLIGQLLFSLKGSGSSK